MPTTTADFPQRGKLPQTPPCNRKRSNSIHHPYALTLTTVRLKKTDRPCDVGPAGSPILRDPIAPAPAEVVLLESTYGDRGHRSLEEETREQFLQILHAAQASGEGDHSGVCGRPHTRPGVPHWRVPPRGRAQRVKRLHRQPDGCLGLRPLCSITPIFTTSGLTNYDILRNTGTRGPKG